MEKLTPGRKLILDLLSKSVAKIKAAECEIKIKESNVKIVSRKKRKTEKDIKENIIDGHCDNKLENRNKIKEEYEEHKFNQEEKEDKKKKRQKKDYNVCITLHENLDAKGFINIKSEQIAKVTDMNDKKPERNLKKQYSMIGKDVTQKTVYKEDSDTSKKHKIQKRKAGTSLKKFSPEEDKIILNAIEKFGDKINFAQLAEGLQRTENSMRHEVRRLKAGKKKKRKHQLFTLSEDLMILDVVLKNMGEESLEIVNLTQDGWREFGAKMGRGEDSPRMRWTRNLRPWILQYYAGTLNLEIRRPLANYLAEHFSDINSVDWHSVIKKPEFAGHTTVSLRSYFSNLFHTVKESLHRDGADITLEMIAEFANTKYASGGENLLYKDLKRQQEIIDHFKSYVKTNCIMNFL